MSVYLQHCEPNSGCKNTSIWKDGRGIPRLDFVWGGGVFPLELQITFKKSHLCQFLMDSNGLYIYGSVMKHTTLQNSGYLEFPSKHAAILDFVFFFFFYKIIVFLHVHHCTL